jgi:hypothetical protein
LLGLLDDIYSMEAPNLPDIVAFYKNSTSTDADAKKVVDLATVACRKLIEMRTTAEYKVAEKLFILNGINMTKVIDFIRNILFISGVL